MVHPNKAVVREYLQAFNQGDLERVGELLADDVVIHFPGRNPISGDKRGKDEVMAFFRVMMERAGVGSTPPDVHDVLASDDHAVALMTQRVAGIDASVAVVYEVREGRITEVWPHGTGPVRCGRRPQQDRRTKVRLRRLAKAPYNALGSWLPCGLCA